MDEVVATDGEAVAIAAHLPYRKLGVGHFAACGDGSSTSVDGIHTVGVHVVGQAARTSDTGYHSDVVRSYDNLGHGLVE